VSSVPAVPAATWLVTAAGSWVSEASPHLVGSCGRLRCPVRDVVAGTTTGKTAADGVPVILLAIPI
jgi:hypothetical protein